MGEVPACMPADGAAVVVRLGLAVLFAISGSLKLWHPKAVVPLLTSVGWPGGVPAVVTAIAAGVGESVLAALLFDGRAAHVALWGASALLVAFAVLIALSMRRGFVGACGCFGAADPTPVGPLHLARNAALAACAIGAVATGGSCLTVSAWSVGLDLVVLTTVLTAWSMAAYVVISRTMTFFATLRAARQAGL